MKTQSIKVKRVSTVVQTALSGVCLSLLAPIAYSGESFIEAFTGGLALYKKQQWDDALAIFDNIQKTVKPGDKASLMYIERCEAMRQNPPGDNWDGVFTMTTK